MVLTKEQIDHNLNSRRKLVTIDELGGDVYLLPMSATMQLRYARELRSSGLIDETIGEEQEFDFDTATDEQIKTFVDISSNYVSKVVVDEENQPLLDREQASMLGWDTIESVLNELAAKKKTKKKDRRAKNSN